MGGDPIFVPKPLKFSPVDVIILSRPCKLSKFLVFKEKEASE